MYAAILVFNFDFPAQQSDVLAVIALDNDIDGHIGVFTIIRLCDGYAKEIASVVKLCKFSNAQNHPIFPRDRRLGIPSPPESIRPTNAGPSYPPSTVVNTHPYQRFHRIPFHMHPAQSVHEAATAAQMHPTRTRKRRVAK